MPSDHRGRSVEVGTRVRVLKLADFLKRDLPNDEWCEISTMVGEVFEVYEIDGYGSAWVEKWWYDSEEECHSHALALDSDEMEVVENSTE